ncbi:MAG: hypothetical protein ACRDZ9_01660, partial [Acidimicrobiales bacterium]
ATPGLGPAPAPSAPTPVPERVWPPPDCPPPPAGAPVDEAAAGPILAADVDGDGCREQVRVAGGVVSAGSGRWSVGTEGDLVVVGDWDCDGLATPGLVRPATGRIWLFPAWASGEAEVPASPAGTTAAPVAAVAVDPDGDGCDEIEVADAAGHATVVDPGP